MRSIFSILRSTSLMLVAPLCVVTLAACGSSDDPDDPEPLTNKDVVTTVLEQGLAGGDVDIFEQYVRDDYIQHSAQVADGRAGLIDAATALAGIQVDIHRVLGEGDMIATHSTYTFPDGSQQVVFDVFRLQDGQLAEHWDALQAAVPASDTVSGRSMVDGPTESTDVGSTDANKRLVGDFIDVALIGGDFSTVTDYISTSQYDQHNPLVADGLEGLNAFVGGLAMDGIAFGYSENHILIGEGSFVLAGSEGFFGPADAPPYAVFYDLFRVDGGKIVEHWDVIPNPAPDPSNLPHNNGLF